jgi:hypothetical protein
MDRDAEIEQILEAMTQDHEGGAGTVVAAAIRMDEQDVQLLSSQSWPKDHDQAVEAAINAGGQLLMLVHLIGSQVSDATGRSHGQIHGQMVEAYRIGARRLQDPVDPSTLTVMDRPKP